MSNLGRVFWSDFGRVDGRVLNGWWHTMCVQCTYNVHTKCLWLRTKFDIMSIEKGDYKHERNDADGFQGR